MTASRTFRTASELRIAEWERDALIDLVAPLSRGEISVTMDHCAECIGGHVAARAPKATRAWPYVTMTRSPALRPLYTPGVGTGAMLSHFGWRATGPEAAWAIVNFLRGAGAKCWDRACDEHEREAAYG